MHKEKRKMYFGAELQSREVLKGYLKRRGRGGGEIPALTEHERTVRPVGYGTAIEQPRQTVNSTLYVVKLEKRWQFQPSNAPRSHLGRNTASAQPRRPRDAHRELPLHLPPPPHAHAGFPVPTHRPGPLSARRHLE